MSNHDRYETIYNQLNDIVKKMKYVVFKVLRSPYF